MQETNNIDKIIADLEANYRKKDKEVLKEILEEINSVAFDSSDVLNAFLIYSKM